MKAYAVFPIGKKRIKYSWLSGDYFIYPSKRQAQYLVRCCNAPLEIYEVEIKKVKKIPYRPTPLV